MHYASMLLTEAQGKALLRAAAIATPTSQEVGDLAEIRPDFFEFPVAVKAQVSAGGRGKAGGIHKADSFVDIKNAFSTIMKTRFGGETPSSVLVESWLAIERELYLAVTIDAQAGGFSILYSPQGGIDIEDGPPPLAYRIGLPRHFRAHAFRKLLEPVERDAKLRERIIALARRLLEVATSNECLTVEINPLVVLQSGSLIAGD